VASFPGRECRGGIVSERTPDLATDAAWEEWGRRDPYFGVITDPKFRRTEINEGTKREFFESGRAHVEYVMQMIRRHIDASFAPRSVLDFGCGVGRTLIPFAAAAEAAVGLDVSPSMLKEAQINCDDYRVTNVRLLLSDDLLSSLTGTFDLIHSFVVLQHIAPERGQELFRRLLGHIAPGGLGAVHVLYSKIQYVETHGVVPPPSHSPAAGASSLAPGRDPDMQMNPYNVNELLFALQRRGVTRFHAEFTDHGGEFGIFLFFQLGS
jgi:SAM-dependent methyltransferase